MATLATVTWRGAVLGRWTARIVGSLLFLLFLALLLGEGPPNLYKLSNIERLQFLGMISLFFGLAVAWKWEGLGGLLSVAGFALLAALRHTQIHQWIFWMPAALGIAHAICWERLRTAPPRGLIPWRLSQGVIAALLSVLGLFLALCANEIFGNPPLMTPALHASDPVVGYWQTTDLQLMVHPDASVTGTIEGTAVTSARIGHRRSWFGRLMHWNSEYMVVGTLGGRSFTMGLWPRGVGLFGSLYSGSRPRLVELRKTSLMGR